MQEIFYKVVSVENGKIYPATKFILCKMGSCRVAVTGQYFIGQTALPETGCGPISAFTSIQSARKFLAIINEFADSSKFQTPGVTYEVYECEGIISNEKELWNSTKERNSIANFDNKITLGSIKLIKKI